MLDIKGLTASVEGNTVLKGVDLHIAPGEVHAIMGPNGAGKSTLASVLSGRAGYTIGGTVTFKGQDLLAMEPEERAAAGVFLAFQYPIEIPGVGNMYFLRTAVNAVREARGEEPLDARTSLSTARALMAELGMKPALLSRSVNSGFSGGEKKRNEVLQMAMLEPSLAILDETDSGLDIDALRAVAAGVEKLRSPDRSMLIITHYPRLLELVKPDFVHVLREGTIERTGDHTLAHRLEVEGYETVVAEAATPR